MNRIKIICLVLFMTGCGHKTPQQRFVEFVSDPKNKITQKITIGDVTAVMKWMPPPYRQIAGQAYEANGYDYFDVKFTKQKSDNLTKEKTMYLDFDMQKDFIMAVDKDSILSSICQRIQNGYSSSYEYMLAFEKEKGIDEKDLVIVYQDKIFGIGTLVFRYNQEDLKKIRTLAVK